MMMKNLITTKTILSVFLIIFFALPVTAQTLTRAEKKALKKELRQYKRNPESYKQMMDMKNQTIDTQKVQIKELEEELAGVKDEKSAVLDSLKALNARYENLVARAEKMTDPRKLPAGTVYQVQVGYYKNIDFQSFNSTVRAVKAEDTGNAKRYVIGYFESQADAMAFAEDLRLLGISDAFVSQYTDGKRNMKFDAYKK